MATRTSLLSERCMPDLVLSQRHADQGMTMPRQARDLDESHRSRFRGRETGAAALLAAAGLVLATSGCVPGNVWLCFPIVDEDGDGCVVEDASRDTLRISGGEFAESGCPTGYDFIVRCDDCDDLDPERGGLVLREDCTVEADYECDGLAPPPAEEPDCE